MTRNMTALIEPILISVLGIGVAILVFAIIVPIYDIANKIQ
jgi:type II secretory pathway component PulF